MGTAKRAFGWRPDTPDRRDYRFAITTAMLKAAPVHADLRPLLPPVYDQGNLGSCVGNALAAAMQFDRRKQGIADYTPSRLMIYYLARALEGSVNSDAGCEIRDAVKQAVKYGACNETLWPYVISKFRSKPPAKCYAAALEDQAVVYERVTQTAAAIEAVIASGFPIVFGIAVYDSFESSAVDKTGNVPMPKRNEQMLGGHAIVLVGYDRASKRFIFRNSWGAVWGAKGYGTLPYDYVISGDLADDFWTIRNVG